MDIKLEKKQVANELKQLISKQDSVNFLVNVITTSQEMVDHINESLTYSNLIIKHEPKLNSLPLLFSEYRNILSEMDVVNVLNVTHELGWTQIESCLIDIQKTKNLTSKDAIYASESGVYNGKPFYDDEVL